MNRQQSREMEAWALAMAILALATGAYPHEHEIARHAWTAYALRDWASEVVTNHNGHLFSQTVENYIQVRG